MFVATICVPVSGEGMFVAKDKILNIRIDPELKKQAKKIAQDEGRSLSNWVTWLISRELKRHRKNSEHKD